MFEIAFLTIVVCILMYIAYVSYIDTKLTIFEQFVYDVLNTPIKQLQKQFPHFDITKDRCFLTISAGLFEIKIFDGLQEIHISLDETKFILSQMYKLPLRVKKEVLFYSDLFELGKIC